MVNAQLGKKRQADAPVVAFDFDGTLTVRDSFMAWLAWRAGPWRFALGLLRLFPAAVAYGFHRDRGRIKAAAVRVFLRGETTAEIESSAAAFAVQSWDGLMRPDALAIFADWKARGAHLVIVTASPDLVVAPFAERLGADALLGTRLTVDGEGRVTGAFHGENCRGEEKVLRLKAHFGADLKLVAAYGDTSGDLEMLAMAAEPGMRVFSGRPRRPRPE